MLDFMVGDWQNRQEYPPSTWLPEGGTGEGSATIRWEVGGLCLVTSYRTKGSMGDLFEGHGITSFDPGENIYIGWWFDSMMPTGAEGRGRLEDGSLVLHFHHKIPGGFNDILSITSPVSESEFRVMGSTLVVGKWVEAVRITYIKV